MSGNHQSTLLHERLIIHAGDVILFATKHRNLPASVRTQMMRSGTAAHALYAEARQAESRKDFVHKLAVADKELAETASWLALSAKILVEPSNDLDRLRIETAELRRIIGASRNTAQQNGRNSA